MSEPKKILVTDLVEAIEFALLMVNYLDHKKAEEKRARKSRSKETKGKQ